MSFEENSDTIPPSETTTAEETHRNPSENAAGPFRRLHPASVIFDVLSHIKTVIFPAAIGFYGATQGDNLMLIFGVLMLVYTIMAAFVRFLSLRFRIQDHELVVSQGIFFKRIRTVPVHRIQNINSVQNLLHRLFRVAEVRVETASGTEPEAILRVLSVIQVQALREAIADSQAPSSAPQPDDSTDTSDSPPSTSTEIELLRIPTSWLVRAGLANNRGMIMIGIVVWFFFQFDLEERFNLDKIDWDSTTQFFGQYATGFAIPLFITAGILIITLLLRLLSIAWFILRFHGYRLTRSGDDLGISCGLLTKVSASVPRGRIQFISIQKNLWMKWMGLSSIRIETAGGSTQDGEDAASSVSSRWFIPVIAAAQVAHIVNQLREGMAWQPDNLDWRPVAPRTATRLTRKAIALSTLIGLIGLAVTQPWGFLAGIAAIIPLILLAIRTSRAMRYARTDDGIVYRSGIITKKTSMTFFDRIQTLTIGQAPFDRRWKMTNLSIDTAAAGPAQHTIQIPYLPEDFAENEYQAILAQASAN